MILFLDDDPNRAAILYQRMSVEEKENTIWCSTVEETIITLKDYYNRLSKVMLDHDLGGETYVHPSREDCGMEVVRFLEKWSEKEPDKFNHLKKADFIVHTWNEKASSKMVKRLRAIGLNVIGQPFGQ